MYNVHNPKVNYFSMPWTLAAELVNYAANVADIAFDSADSEGPGTLETNILNSAVVSSVRDGVEVQEYNASANAILNNGSISLSNVVATASRYWDRAIKDGSVSVHTYKHRLNNFPVAIDTKLNGDPSKVSSFDFPGIDLEFILNSYENVRQVAARREFTRHEKKELYRTANWMKLFDLTGAKE